jgi:MoaA/NifB/PqqE/SkfB family radical SAM enzyme
MYGDITRETYIELLDRHKDAKIVKLQGLGEPMFYPMIYDLIDIAKDRGHEVMIITNGTIRLPNKVDYLVVSLETLNVERYKELRGGDISVVLNNIHDAYDRNLPLIINCVMTHLTTKQDVEEVHEFAMSIGANFWQTCQEVWVAPGHRDYEEGRKKAMKAAWLHEYYVKEKVRMKSCGWRQGTAIYYDYQGRQHPCCIRMSDEYLGAPSKTTGCKECPW